MRFSAIIAELRLNVWAHPLLNFSIIIQEI